MPMVIGTKWKPLSQVIDPKFNRGLPVTISRPTAVRSSPKEVLTRVFEGLPVPSPTKVLKASIMIANISGGPKRRARRARGSAAATKKTAAMMIPTKEARKEVASASPDFPCFDIGYPSKMSATDHGSPGMANSTDVITPPKRAPQ